jgi:hypothetical protein
MEYSRRWLTGKHWRRTAFGREGLIEPTTHAQYKTTVSKTCGSPKLQPTVKSIT